MNNNPFKGIDIFVVRVMKNGSLGLSKPCHHCTESMKRLGIKRVYYSTDNGWKCEKIIDIDAKMSAGNRHC